LSVFFEKFLVLQNVVGYEQVKYLVVADSSKSVDSLFLWHVDYVMPTEIEINCKVYIIDDIYSQRWQWHGRRRKGIFQTVKSSHETYIPANT
jgi:hypothetical protein